MKGWDLTLRIKARHRFFNIIQPFQNTSVSKKKKDVTG